MEKYICSICDYIYDPKYGDDESAILANTPFEDLPENWNCPHCGVGKDEFEKYEE